MIHGPCCSQRNFTTGRPMYLPSVDFYGSIYSALPGDFKSALPKSFSYKKIFSFFRRSKFSLSHFRVEIFRSNFLMKSISPNRHFNFTVPSKFFTDIFAKSGSKTCDPVSLALFVFSQRTYSVTKKFEINRRNIETKFGCAAANYLKNEA